MIFIKICLVKSLLYIAAQLLAIVRLPEAVLLLVKALRQKLMVLPWGTGLM